MHGTAKNQAGSWRSCLLFNAFFAAKLVFSVCPGRQTTVDEVLRILILVCCLPGLVAPLDDLDGSSVDVPLTLTGSIFRHGVKTPGQYSSAAPPGALALSSP
jgi:hypothetical protein